MNENSIDGRFADFRRVMKLLEWQHIPQRLWGILLDSPEEIAQIVGSKDNCADNVSVDRDIDKPWLGHGIDTYIVGEGENSYPVAHGCNQCGRIVIGPPKIKVYDWPRMVVKHHCRNCDEVLVEERV